MATRAPTLGLVVLLAACGEGDDSVDAGTRDAGAAYDNDARTSSASGESCPATSGQERGACSEAEFAAYGACIEDACAATLERCNGKSYREGEFSGPCAQYLSCIADCDCSDDSCVGACAYSDECATCMLGLSACASACVTQHRCIVGDVGGGVRTDAGTGALDDAGASEPPGCAALQACCDSLAGEERAQCNVSYGVAAAEGSDGDATCGAIVASFCP